MGGFVVVPQEPGPVMAGQVFRVIPASGVLTDGDDTLIGSWVTDFHVSGGQGDDLLVLDYTGSLVRLELDAAYGSVGIKDAEQAWLAGGSVTDFERFRLTGGDLQDTISGNRDGGATLSGGAGDDLITMRGGLNLVRGGAGNDTIYGATLSDTVSGGAGADVLFVDLSGAAAGVQLRAGTAYGSWTGFKHYAGTLTALDDTLHAGALLWDVRGGAGEDEIRLNYTALDTLIPGTSIRFDSGYGGYATLSVTWPDEFPTNILLQDFERFRVTGTAQGDVMTGGAGADVLRGQAGNDSLYGGGGQDSLFGGAGDDYITGSGAEGGLLSGGAGNDTIAAWRVDDTISGGAGFDRLQLDLWDHAAGVQIDLVSGMPNWSGIEVVNGSLSRQDDTFRTGVVTGDIWGEDGIDLLGFDYARSGVDGIAFSFGRLTVVIGRNAEVLYVSGFEVFDLRGSAGGDSLQGDALADTLAGDRGDDMINGAAGNDWLQGDQGNDSLSGDAGADTLDGGSGNDTLSGGDGADVLYGQSGDDSLSGGLGRDMLFGGEGRDSLSGGWGADTLIGDAGSDTLSGGEGDDWLTGGAGHDVLIGGNGADRFVFHTGGALGSDRITDFDLALDRLAFNDEAGFADLTVTQAPGGARIAWDGGSVLLDGIDAADVTAAILL
jgi:Ca2+-binding RTX toxin-like protein